MRRSRLVCLFIAVAVSLTGCTSTPAPDAEPPRARVSFDDGYGQIFVMNEDGTGLRQVTPTVTGDMSDTRYANYASMSPDGSTIVYTRAGRFIESVDLASGDSRTLYEGGYQPVFSPDGSTIAFTSLDGISAMNADGSDVRLLAREESAFGATFTPDATQVVFDIGGYIVSVPAAGGEKTVLLRDQFWNADPTFSPDGSTMVFSSNRGGNNGSEVYSMPAAGGPITALTETYAVHPQFTSDGSRIVYSRATTRTGELVTDIVDYDRSELATMNVDGTDQIRLTPQSITSQDPSVGGGNR
ncbi:PD40 domain-containing protein [Rhodococcus fascians]|nr:PD40 domain-containing protein [Rhodococcus fascians]